MKVFVLQSGVLIVGIYTTEPLALFRKEQEEFSKPGNYTISVYYLDDGSRIVEIPA